LLAKCIWKLHSSGAKYAQHKLRRVRLLLLETVMAAVMERQKSFTLVPLRETSQSSFRGGPPEPPRGGGGGGGASGFPFLLLLVVLVVVIAVMFGPLWSLANSYAVAATRAIESGAVYRTTIVLFWIFILGGLVLLIVLRKKSGTLLFVTNVRSSLRRKSARAFIIGGLVISACFETAIYFLNFEAIIASQILALAVTVAHVIEQLRLRYYPQDRNDVDSMLIEIEAENATA
jgi:hypothetical protein